MPTKQPLNSYFFPNPHGDQQPVVIEAESLADALAQLATEEAPQPEPTPTPSATPALEPITATADPALADNKESN